MVMFYFFSPFLSRLVAPLIQGYEDAGDFTVMERLKTSIHVNLIFYFILGSIGLVGLILLFTMRQTKLVSFLYRNSVTVFLYFLLFGEVDC